jgi:chitodextrinase
LPVVSSTQDALPPSAPTNLSATASGYTNVNLSWTPSTDNVGVYQYYVYRGSSVIATTFTNSYTDPTVTAGGAYSYYIRAADAAGNISGVSNVAAIVMPSPNADTIPPTAPRSLKSTKISQSSISMSWTASTDNVKVVGYRIMRNGQMIATVTGTSFGDGTVARRTQYTYQVVAIDAAGNVSQPSNSLLVKTK